MIQFDCRLDDVNAQLSGAHLYLKGAAATVVTDFERAAGRPGRAHPQQHGPPDRRRRAPSHPGAYRWTLVGARGSKTWPVQVH